VKILIATGPTGGHFFPGLALAERIRKMTDWSVVMVVPPRPALRAWLVRKEISSIELPDVPFKLREFWRLPGRWLNIFRRAGQIITREKPSLVVGTGSYASLAVVLAAWMNGCRVVVHEQNIVAGKTTRLLSLLADRVAVTFPETRGLSRLRCEVTGLPLLEDFSYRLERNKALESLGLDAGKVTLLVMGGSQASRALNRLVLTNLKLFRKENLQCLHLAGPEREEVGEAYRRAGVRARVFDFSCEMGLLYSASDVAVARAGAGTLVELVNRQLPAILVPYPYAGGHQRENARWLLKKGGCLLLEQGARMREEFPSLLQQLLKERDLMRARLSRLHLTDDRECFLSLIKGLVASKKRKDTRFSHSH